MQIMKYKVGKHVHSKAAIKGHDVITGKTTETHKPTHGMIGCPKVNREL